MFVGEGPGRVENELGRPFVGESGMVLQKIVKELDLTIHDLYVTNVIKHRPPKNRDPTIDEIVGCSSFLIREIQLVRPKVILALGRVATTWFYSMSDEDFKGRTRGHVLLYDNIPVHTTWHPAYVLRKGLDSPEYEQLKADVAKVKELITCGYYPESNQTTTTPA